MKITEKLDLRNCDNMDLMREVPDNYFDLAIVDPPYRDAKENDMFPQNRKNIKKGRLKDWSDKPNKIYFEELKRVSKNQIIWGANNFELPQFKGFFVWDKDIAFDMKFSQCEIASLSENLSTVSKMYKLRASGCEKRIHPTQKPVKLYEFLLMQYGKQGDKILDTHLGSMSIALACHNLGFELTGCELDSEYYEQGIKRVKNHIKQLTLF